MGRVGCAFDNLGRRGERKPGTAIEHFPNDFQAILRKRPAGRSQFNGDLDGIARLTQRTAGRQEEGVAQEWIFTKGVKRPARIHCSGLIKAFIRHHNGRRIRLHLDLPDRRQAGLGREGLRQACSQPAAGDPLDGVRRLALQPKKCDRQPIFQVGNTLRFDILPTLCALIPGRPGDGKLSQAFNRVFQVQVNGERILFRKQSRAGQVELMGKRLGGFKQFQWRRHFSQDNIGHIAIFVLAWI